MTGKSEGLGTTKGERGARDDKGGSEGLGMTKGSEGLGMMERGSG
jgi:hypothetical protein